MSSFAHENLRQRLLELEAQPKDEESLVVWLRAEPHLSLLHEDARGDNLILYGSGTHSFVQTVLVDKSILEKRDRTELLAWSGNPFDAAPSYEAGSTGCWIVPGDSSLGTELLQDAKALVIGRMSHDRTYFEILQEFLQVSDIHWHDERRAYCKYDTQGDLSQVVSVTQREEEPITLITCRRAELDTYLEATHTVLVRLFDFFLWRSADFRNWVLGDEESCVKKSEGNGTSLLYLQEIVEGKAAYARGGQFICPRKPSPSVSAGSMARANGNSSRKHVEFLALDWRNDNRVVPISTDPAATTDYFRAHGNKLPFELSPAFFNPEVLLRYKGDTEKYKMENGTISCRDSWYLRGFGFNDADQVHAYICDLRNLPHWEQRYWQLFNEEPKAPLTRSTIETDFRGEFPSSGKLPLPMLKAILRKWGWEECAWWKLKDRSLLERINTPHSGSRDEWGLAFLGLAQVVVEGFEVKEIRRKLKQKGVESPGNEKSIRLLERLLEASGSGNERLKGLRTVNHIRNKAVAHADSGEGKLLVQNALAEHHTLARHFDSVCRLLADEAKRIEKAFMS